MLRPGEHHVLEQMRKARSRRLFVRGADVIPEVHRNDRQALIRRKNHFETVVEMVLGERDRRRRGDVGFRRIRRKRQRQKKEGSAKFHR